VRLELLPLIFGVLVALLGVGLIADGWMPDRDELRGDERRRRQRAERDRRGEIVVGLGVLALAAALIGRDTWRYGNVAVLVGVALLAAGAVLNRRYLREVLTFRGAARRGRSADRPAAEPPDARPPERKMRIR
jgi:drug/metabolite transporter (DMT)-like permease